MKELTKKYYSKLLLFGEYTVTVGSGALALPYSGYWGKWEMGTASIDENNGLQKLYQYLVDHESLKHIYDTKAFKEEIDQGLYFSSDIPQGYGLGSSGALVAAVYDRFAQHQVTDLKELKPLLAQTECAFHGASSGVDPLVAYIGVPVLIKSDGTIVEINHTIDLNNIFLVDTGITRKTDEYIDIFKNKFKTIQNFSSVVDDLNNINQKAIQATLSNNREALFDAFSEISNIQYEYFSEMIPASLMQLWNDGIKSKNYSFKLCGAGGGGMMLCMVHPSQHLPVGLKSFPYFALH